MNQTAILLPANCVMVTEDEMVYLDGGAQAVPSVSSIFAGIGSSIAEFCDVMWYSIKSCARSFVEITMDDLRNPNFQGAVATVTVLAIVSFLMD